MNIENLYDSAQKFIELKKYKKALKVFFEIEKAKRGLVAIDIAILYADMSMDRCKKYTREEIKWYKVAIENGNCDANTNIAICYQSIRKIKKAKKYFKQAIKCGDIDASLDLALIYISELRIKKAKKYLEIVLTGISYETVTESSVKHAKKLLKRINSLVCSKTGL